MASYTIIKPSAIAKQRLSEKVLLDQQRYSIWSLQRPVGGSGVTGGYESINESRRKLIVKHSKKTVCIAWKTKPLNPSKRGNILGSKDEDTGTETEQNQNMIVVQ